MKELFNQPRKAVTYTWILCYNYHKYRFKVPCHNSIGNFTHSTKISLHWPCLVSLFSLTHRVKRVRFSYFRFHSYNWLTLQKLFIILFTLIEFWFGIFPLNSYHYQIIFRIRNKKWQKETRGDYQVFMYHRYRKSTFYKCMGHLWNIAFAKTSRNERHIGIQSNYFYKCNLQLLSFSDPLKFNRSWKSEIKWINSTF